MGGHLGGDRSLVSEVDELADLGEPVGEGRVHDAPPHHGHGALGSGRVERGHRLAPYPASEGPKPPGTGPVGARGALLKVAP